MPRKSTIADRVRDASAKRRDEHRTDTREIIFRAAADLLDESGYDGFSLRKLAERIGYTPTTIYRYFRDKDDLVIAILLEGYGAFTRALTASIEVECDPSEHLDRMGRAYVAFGLSHPVMYRVLFMQRSDFWNRIPPERLALVCGADSFELLVGVVQREIESGRTRTKDVQGTAMSLWALVHGAVTLCLTMPGLAEPAAREMLTESILAMANQQLYE